MQTRGAGCNECMHTVYVRERALSLQTRVSRRWWVAVGELPAARSTNDEPLQERSPLTEASMAILGTFTPNHPPFTPLHSSTVLGSDCP